MTALMLAAVLLLAPVCRVWAADGENAEQGTAVSAEGAAEQTLEEFMESFRAENGLDEDNFSISYYNPGSGERYSFGADRLMLAASTYKVPLNMYYYDLERAGEIASDRLIRGYALNVCHEQSIVYSNNEISEAMIYAYPGSFFAYKNAMLELFGMEDAELSSDFYYDNYYSTGMMMAALERLYENADDYEELIGYMKESFPQEGYFRRYVTDCEVAHKYGSFEGAENDIGIVYADQPFLLAVYTYYSPQTPGEEVCARAAQVLKDYTDAQYARMLAEEQAAQEEAERQEAERLAAEEEQARLEQERAEAEAEARAREEEAAAREEALRRQEEERLAQERAAAAAEAAQQAEAEPPQEKVRVEWTDYLWMIAVAVGILLLGGAVLYSVFHKVGKYEARMKKKYGKYMKK